MLAIGGPYGRLLVLLASTEPLGPKYFTVASFPIFLNNAETTLTHRIDSG
jgi:hypothetical protein